MTPNIPRSRAIVIVTRLRRRMRRAQVAIVLVLLSAGLVAQNAGILATPTSAGAAAASVSTPQQRSSDTRGLPTAVASSRTRATGGPGEPTGSHGPAVPASALANDSRGIAKAHTPVTTPSRGQKPVAATTTSSGSTPAGYNPATSVEVPSAETATTRVYRNTDGTYTATVSSATVNVKRGSGSWQHLPGTDNTITPKPTTTTSVDQTAAATPATASPSQYGAATYVVNGAPGNHATDGYLYSYINQDNAFVQFPSLTYSAGSPGAFQNAYVTSASLSVDVLQTSGSPTSTACAKTQLELDPVGQAWSASTLASYPGPTTSGANDPTYAIFGGAGSGVGASCPVSGQITGTPHTVTIPATDFVQNWVHGWSANNGMYLNAVSSTFLELSNTGSNAPFITLNYAPHGDGANYVETSFIAPVNNQPGSASVDVLNAGSTTWTSTNGYKLDYSLYSVSGSTVTPISSPSSVPTVIPSTVAPNAKVTLGVTLPALSPGTYRICYDMRDTTNNTLFSALGVITSCYALPVQNNPPVIDKFVPANNAIVYSLTPVLSVVAHDPDNYPAGAQLTYSFALYQNGNSTAIASSGSSTASSFTVPANTLAFGGLYYWTVQVSDGVTASPVSTPDYFTVPSAEQPLLTSHLGAAPYDTTVDGVTPSAGNYSTATTDASVPDLPSDEPVDVVRTYNSLDPRAGTAFGSGWSAAIDARAMPDNDSTGNVLVTLPDGRQERFAHNASGAFSAPDGVQAWLQPISGGFQLTDAQHTVYTFTQQTVDPLSGQSYYGLTAIGANSHTSLVTISWQSNYYSNVATGQNAAFMLPTIESAPGTHAPTLKFSWSFVSITTASGSVIVPRVSQVGFAVANDQNAPADNWTYQYNSADQLTSVCPPTSQTACTAYTYTSGAQSGSHFASMIQDSNPANYYRLSDAAGSANAADAVAQNENSSAASASNVTFGQNNHLPGTSATAASFNGTSSVVNLPSHLLTGSYLALGLWFNTTQTGGTLLSYQSDKPGTAQATNPHVPTLYVGADGKLRGEMYDASGVGPAVSAVAVNDGKWHYAVLSTSGTTQTLYLDGAVTATRAGKTLVDNTLWPYTSLGVGTNAGWDSSGSATNPQGWFNGQLSDFWYTQYPVGLPAVQQEYGAAALAASELVTTTAPSGKLLRSITYDSTTDRAVQVSDANGGTWKLPNPTTAGSPGYFEGAVAQTHPDFDYPLSETNSSTAVNIADYGGIAVHHDDATYSSVELGLPGLFDGGDETSAGFNGTSSRVDLPPEVIPFYDYTPTIALWFKTTTAGGTLISASSSPFGASPNSTDPILYVGTDGKLHGGLYDPSNYAILPVTSKTAVNDGKWHYAMISAGNNRYNSAQGKPADPQDDEILWLDGQVQQDAGVFGSGGTYFNNYLYSEVGAGSSAGSTASDSATNAQGYFQGQIAHVNIWQTVVGDRYPNAPTAIFRARNSSTGLLPTTTQLVVDPANNTSSYAFDPGRSNRTIGYTNASGNTTRFTYDDGGFLSAVIDPNSDATNYRHDSLGDTVWTETCPIGSTCNTATAAFDTSTSATDFASGKPLTATDPLGQTTTNQYNSDGLLASTTTPPAPGFASGRTTSYAYTSTSTTAADGGASPGGQLLTSTTPGGSTTGYSYYSSGQLASTTTPLGEKLSYNYASHVYGYASLVDVSSSFPSGVKTSFTYDAQNRVVTETDPTITDAVTGLTHTRRTTYTRDADGNILTVAISDLTGHDATRKTTYTYGANDKVASVTDPNKNVTRYTYDAFGNLASTTRPDGSTISLTYSPTNQLTVTTLTNWKTGPSSTASLPLETRAYDPAGRLATVTDSMGRVESSYLYWNDNTIRSLTHGSSGGATTTQVMSYDADDHLVSESQGCDSTGNNCQGGATQWQYDADGFNVETAFGVHGATYTGIYDDDVVGYAYDGDGNATTRIEYDGSYQAPPNGNPPPNPFAGYSDRKTTYTYDAAGDRTSTVAENGTASSLTSSTSYDTRGLPIQATDANGNKSYTTFDQLGQPTIEQGAAVAAESGGGAPATLSPQTRLGYDTFGDVEASQDPVGNATSYAYDGDGNRTSAVAPQYEAPTASTASSATTSWTYDSLNRQTSVTDPLNRTTTTTYDQLSDPLGQTLPGSRTTSATYDTDGEQLSSTDPNGAVTQATYDDLGERITNTALERSPAAAFTTSYTYDRLGDQTSVITPRSFTTTTSFNELGEPVRSTDALNRATSLTYGFPGQLASATAPDGTSTRATYDEAGRETGLVNLDASGNTAKNTLFTYDNNGNRLSSSIAHDTLSAGQTLMAGQQLTSQDGSAELAMQTDGNAVVYGPSGYLFQTGTTGSNNRLVLQTDGNLVVYSSTGVALWNSGTSGSGSNNRLVMQSDHNLVLYTASSAVAWQSGTRGSGSPATPYVDPASLQTNFAYNSHNALISNTQQGPSGTTITTSIGYDADGRPTRRTTPNGNIYDYTYNSLGLPESQIAPTVAGDSAMADRSTTLSYDLDGRPTTETRPGGVALTYAYNAAGQLTSEAGSGAEVSTATRTFGYDADGNMTTASVPTGTNTYGYDDRGLLTAASGPGGSASFGYDSDGNLSTRTDAAGSASFTYDAADEVSAQSGTASVPATYSYTAAGQVNTATYSGVGTDTYTYTAQHQVSTQSFNAAAGTTGNLTRSYVYDPAGQMTAQTVTAGSTTALNQTYGYDSAGRLASTTSGAATTTYTYDGDGNRTTAGSSTYSYNARDQLTSGGSASAPTTYGYSLRGSLSSVTASGGSAAPVKSDAFDEQLQYGSSTYAYDALGRVTSATTGGTTYAMSYDGPSDAIVSDGTQTFGRAADGQTNAVTASGHTDVALTSGHGDIEGLANSSGLVGTRTYGPTGVVNSTSGVTADLGYQGGWTDPGTAEVATASRWYQPSIDAFTSADSQAGSPTPAAVNANSYAYANDDPLDNTDLSGNDACSDTREKLKDQELQREAEVRQEQQKLDEQARDIARQEEKFLEHEAQQEAQLDAESQAQAQADAVNEANTTAEDKQIDRDARRDAERDPDDDLDPDEGPDVEIDPYAADDPISEFLNGAGEVGSDIGGDVGGEFGAEVGEGLFELGAGLLGAEALACDSETPGQSTPEQTGELQGDSSIEPGSGGDDSPLTEEARQGPVEQTSQQTQAAETPSQAEPAMPGDDGSPSVPDMSDATPPSIENGESVGDQAGTESPQSLFHYTSEEGQNGILDSGELNPSLRAVNPNDARYGDGQYFSDIRPGTYPNRGLSSRFIRNPFQGAKFSHYIEVDVSDLEVIEGRPGVFVVPNQAPLNLLGRILSWGLNE